MNRLTKCAVGAICLATLVGGATPASAQYPAGGLFGPIEIQKCSMTLGGGDNAFFNVYFVNHAPVAANAIDFTIWWGDQTISSFRDVGKYSPNISIRNALNVPIGIRQIGPRLWLDARLSVDQVQFADGTTWTSEYQRMSYEQQIAQERPKAVVCPFYR